MRTHTLWTRKKHTRIRFLTLGFLVFLAATIAVSGQQNAPPSPSTKGSARPTTAEDFAQTTDEVLGDMSKLLGLPQLEPLKKSLRSRQEIRDYVIRQMKEDKEPEKRYADQVMLQKMGLLPKGFELDSFLVELLTEQIAGLYDPKAKEFYVADWIPVEDQREVMAHELTHALQDQHYHLEQWHDAAKPNDDAGSARDAVLEGSAVASMIDYGLRKAGKSLADLHGISLSAILGNGDDSPMLKKAPPFLRDDLLFPYAAGGDFALRVLTARGGWPGFHTVFENPPVSTQQILHPDLYLRGLTPPKVSIPDLSKDLGQGWKKLDENILGEFGLKEFLKQFLGEEEANNVSPLWAGDRYAIYETRDKKEAMLTMRFHASSGSDAGNLYRGLKAAFDKKYLKQDDLFVLEEFLSDKEFLAFNSTEGGVFLRCQGAECVTLEGGDRKAFDAFVKALGWPANPVTKAAPTRSEFVRNGFYRLHTYSRNHFSPSKTGPEVFS
jgi:hypothetical protein